MTIPVTEFKKRCLEILREVESRGEPIDISRRGRIVARISPLLTEGSSNTKPWERLRGKGTLSSSPEESVLTDFDFEALQ